MNRTEDYTDTVAMHHLVAALWSSYDEAGIPLDANYLVTDFTDEASASLMADAIRFTTEAGDLLDGLDAEAVGHDLWLTRNHHGAGFWDRGILNGEALTALAHTFGEVDLYVTDDGQVDRM